MLRPTVLARWSVLVCLFLLLLAHATHRPSLAQTTTLRVPQEYATIQAAIDAAPDGALVLVAPGTYSGTVKIDGKRITLASEFHTTHDPARITQTMLDGQQGENVVELHTGAAGSQIIGFTIQNASNGIWLRTEASILNNIVRDTGDGIDSGNGRGLIKGNVFENNEDDGIDFDAASSGTVEDNIIRNNGDDGFETRLHDYDGPQLTITLRGNTITGNEEDGIQLIDYPGVSKRVYWIERNLIQGNAFVGIGLMDNGDTREDYRGASIPERIHVYNNTIVDHPYALTGGDNLIALNNLIIGSSIAGLKNVDGGSVAAHNLFWQNELDFVDSNVDGSTTLFVNPALTGKYELAQGSPAIDAGTHLYVHQGETVLNYPVEGYAGGAPDLGWREVGELNDPAATPTPHPDMHLPIILAAGDIATCAADARAQLTANLLDSLQGTVVALGDNAYTAGTLDAFTNCFGPTWGRHKARIRPVPGNHEYVTGGASGYFTYFGQVASPLDANCTSGCKGYYSYDLGDWHVVALNSEIDMGEDSPQVEWLRSDLAAHPTACTLAYFHRPLFTSGQHGGASQTLPLWQALYEYGADVILNAHDHHYERFALQRPDGAPDPEHGIRQFIVGTGGNSLRPFAEARANSQARDFSSWGVLKLSLNATSYDWEFVPVEGQGFRDGGSSPCVAAAPPPLTPVPTGTSIPPTTPVPAQTPPPTATQKSEPAEQQGHVQFLPLIP